jgi:phage shock protein PspC (stress-responsive transcriptional regulator)
MSGKAKILLGVCGWLGAKLNIDPTIVRIAFIIIVFAGGAGLLLYLVLWIVKILEEK